MSKRGKSAQHHTALSQLGRKVAIPESPDHATLERVPNPHAARHYLARFAAPEFTSLCPITGQPDFAHLVIDYVPHLMADREQVIEVVLGLISQSWCIS